MSPPRRISLLVLAAAAALAVASPVNPLVPGTYKNVIQVLNPNPNPVDVTLQVLLTDYGPGIPGTPPSVRGPEIAVRMEAVDAFEIDCESIADHTGLSRAALVPFYKGFVLLRVHIDVETQMSKASYKLVVQDVHALKNIEPDAVVVP